MRLGTVCCAVARHHSAAVTPNACCAVCRLTECCHTSGESIAKMGCCQRLVDLATVAAEAALEHVNTHGVVGTTWVIQKYIENPMLIAGRKFDIRSYVLVTHDRRVFFHAESYVRTSSTPFSLDNLQDRCIHLTNDAVQKTAQHYEAFEDHNKLTMQQLQRILTEQGHKIDVENELYPQMRQAASHVFSAALAAMTSAQLNHCFELFGLDFMIGQDKQVSGLDARCINWTALSAKMLHGWTLATGLNCGTDCLVGRQIDCAIWCRCISSRSTHVPRWRCEALCCKTCCHA